MSELVERLREPIDPDDPNLWIVDKDRMEAANRIEALKTALENVTKWKSFRLCHEIARAALGKDAT